jgi:hypothetical protein
MKTVLLSPFSPRVTVIGDSRASSIPSDPDAHRRRHCLSWGPLIWVMLGGIFPNQIRGCGLAVAYGLYTLAALVSIYFVLRNVHETRGKELEQMEG